MTKKRKKSARLGMAHWVNEETGNDANDGLSPEKPLRTRQEAIARCLGIEGEAVYIMPKQKLTKRDLLQCIEDLETRVAALELLGQPCSPCPYLWQHTATRLVDTPVPYETTTAPDTLPLVEVS